MCNTSNTQKERKCIKMSIDELTNDLDTSQALTEGSPAAETIPEPIPRQKKERSPLPKFKPRQESRARHKGAKAADSTALIWHLLQKHTTL